VISWRGGVLTVRSSNAQPSRLGVATMAMNATTFLLAHDADRDKDTGRLYHYPRVLGIADLLSRQASEGVLVDAEHALTVGSLGEEASAVSDCGQ
jgi:hypothetical protein